MASEKNCGPHTELVSNNQTRVTRCACGTVHVVLHSSGITIRMSEAAFRNTASGLKIALERLDESLAAGSALTN